MTKIYSTIEKYIIRLQYPLPQLHVRTRSSSVVLLPGFVTSTLTPNGAALKHARCARTVHVMTSSFLKLISRY